jgi:RimJ/RimL family protein N-acetyltransferase
MRDWLSHFLKRRLLLVYRLVPGAEWSAREETALSEADWTWADMETVTRFFAQHSRERTFAKFVEHGFTGLISHLDNAWIGYAWMATPWTEGPPHLPGWVGDLGAYWIFYCRTREGFRRRGLYKSALRRLIGQARQDAREASILIDTSPTNVPSRRAIVSVGFRPEGAIVTSTLQLPRLARWVYGNWRRDFVHPPLVEEAQTGREK